MTNLVPGTSYKFTVESRNVVGYSPASQVITILTAQTPDAPTNLANDAPNTNANQISLVFDSPSFEGGSQVLSYRLWYDNASGTGTF